VHELSICQALIDQLEVLAREQSAAEVSRVALGIGPLSGIEPALLQHAYPIAAAGTVAENSVLTVEERPVRVHCSQCGLDSDAAANRLLCAHCGDWRTELISGDELLLMQVEFTREAVHV
jgi:hydrogenase nickel incorporation protein HypA/HybF